MQTKINKGKYKIYTASYKDNSQKYVCSSVYLTRILEYYNVNKEKYPIVWLYMQHQAEKYGYHNLSL